MQLRKEEYNYSISDLNQIEGKQVLQFWAIQINWDICQNEYNDIYFDAIDIMN